MKLEVEPRRELLGVVVVEVAGEVRSIAVGAFVVSRPYPLDEVVVPKLAETRVDVVAGVTGACVVSVTSGGTTVPHYETTQIVFRKQNFLY